ncbi:TetR family transcriptional regulator [Mycolicibacterium elephantis]|uniref:TetR/AcrR family transcriptional regulator n=1 Tax=Mycolicibacterium elephantis TaxID=81858 RepID=UPI0007EADD47|nr:TetR/AcrR family transcriptional regulator [Mycolicibacterium elephantis]OBB18770.1 TetR family transcriptional regulator [Mycolicibacterium elephantis]OBE99600.1 TetR family transcriptional regulator [Mycolicibacterium elephantis]
MTEQVDRRSDGTRLQIVHAAARLFAERPYSRVSLDDILADASVTKGAMYFHFRSKHALATAIVEHRSTEAKSAVTEVLARRLSGLETLVDICFLVATDDIGDHLARAGLNLLESVGRTDGLQARVLTEWVDAFAETIKKAIGEGDVRKDVDPTGVARLLVSMYLGLRQTSDLADPERFLRDLEAVWTLAVPGFVADDRKGYVIEFIKRRTAIAIRKAKPLPG